jgi:hypothetical protein
MKSLSTHKLHPRASPSTVHINLRHYPGSAKGSMCLLPAVQRIERPLQLLQRRQKQPRRRLLFSFAPGVQDYRDNKSRSNTKALQLGLYSKRFLLAFCLSVSLIV